MLIKLAGMLSTLRQHSEGKKKHPVATGFYNPKPFNHGQKVNQTAET